MNRKGIRYLLAFGGLTMIAACGNAGGGDVTDGGSGGGGGGSGDELDGSIDCQGPPGLYQAGSCDVLADGVEPYQPRYPFWSDGAKKERYVALPPGSTIDTSDPDGWIFPVGTRLYKTFIVDGKRIETRLLEKVDGDVASPEGADGGATDGGAVMGTVEAGMAHWNYLSYAWNEAQTAVTAVPEGVTDALGTGHDIPSQSDCVECHQSVAKDVALGFSAIQLNHDLAGLRLDTLNGRDQLSNPIALIDAEVPGDETARRALGYLHANCGHCHGGESTWGSGDGSPPLRMRLEVGVGGVENTDTYLTAVGVLANWMKISTPRYRIEPGSPETSAIYVRMGLRDVYQMPPVGTEVVDDVGRDAVGAWIASLTP